MPLAPSYDIDEEMKEIDDEIYQVPLFSTYEIEDAVRSLTSTRDWDPTVSTETYSRTMTNSERN